MPRRTPPRPATSPRTAGRLERFISDLIPDMQPVNLIPVDAIKEVDLSTVVPALEKDIKDMEVQEPVEGSPFQRKGMAECITDEYDSLTKYKLYKIEELSEDGDEFQLMDDKGGTFKWYSQKLFRAIDHGPFRPDDTVRIDDVTGIIVNGTQLSHDYDGNQWTVIKQKGENVELQYCGSSSMETTVPCVQAKMVKRYRFYDSNPFHKGDRVKVVKDLFKHEIYTGDVYTVSGVRDDRISLEERSPDQMFYHVNFAKHVMKVKSFKKKKNKITMTDLIRKTVNDNCYKKLSPYDVLKILKDKMPNEDITINEVNKQMKEMFRW
jgi:hypothetical protein